MEQFYEPNGETNKVLPEDDLTVARLGRSELENLLSRLLECGLLFRLLHLLVSLSRLPLCLLLRCLCSCRLLCFLLHLLRCDKFARGFAGAGNSCDICQRMLTVNI